MKEVDYTDLPHNFDWSKTYSLVEILGQPLPVHPEVKSEKFGMRFLLEGKFEEGDVICTECLTTTPDTPNSHHVDCFNYRDSDTYCRFDTWFMKI